MEMQGLFEAIHHPTAVVDIHIEASKTKAMSLLTHSEQLQAVLLGGEPYEVVDKLKYLGSPLIAENH